MDYLKQYNKWLNEPTLDPSLKEELLKMDEKEKQEAFYKDIEFGTAGARGIMGPGTNRLNLYTVKKLTLGFAKYIKRVAKTTNYSIAIGYDNRYNSQHFAYVAARVLASEGIKTYIVKELRPSPFVSYMVRHFGCDGGIMITASHNPKEYNGFKVYDPSGSQIFTEEAKLLAKEVEKIKDYFHIQEYNSPNYIKEVGFELDYAYLSLVKDIQLTTFKEKPLKFVYSPLHGTGGTLINKLLKELGYDIYPVEKQMVVDPAFTYAKSSNPEDIEAFELGLKEAKKINADMVLTTDPDADRLGIMVKHHGEYIFLNGNQTAALELYYVLSRRKDLNKLDPNGLIYVSNVSTPLIKDLGAHYGIEVKEVLTGFKHIGKAIRETDRTYIFGAEESFGSLVAPFVRDKDAVQAVLLLVEMATYYHTLNKTLYDVLMGLYKLLGSYAEKTLSLTYEGIEGEQKIKRVMKHFRNNPLQIKGETLYKAEDYLSLKAVIDGKEVPIDFDQANVLRYTYKSNNIAIIRPSGTEPKLRVYLYVKADSLENAANRLEEIENNILKQIEVI